MIENRERTDGLGGPADFRDFPINPTTETIAEEVRTFYPADDISEAVLFAQGD